MRKHWFIALTDPFKGPYKESGLLVYFRRRRDAEVKAAEVDGKAVPCWTSRKLITLAGAGGIIR